MIQPSDFDQITIIVYLNQNKKSYEQLHLTSTGGTISLNDLTAQSCTIDTTNADTQTDHLTGAVTYLSKGGNLTVTNASGSGNFQATGDGSMELAFTTVSGDLTAYTRNGDLTLTLPSSKEGHIQAPFSGALSPTGNIVGGTIGNHAEVKVALETKEGEIVVKIQE